MSTATSFLLILTVLLAVSAFLNEDTLPLFAILTGLCGVGLMFSFIWDDNVKHAREDARTAMRGTCYPKVATNVTLQDTRLVFDCANDGRLRKIKFKINDD